MTDETIDPRFLRYREAYLAMDAQAKYRPAAPSDGWSGTVQLTREQINDPVLLAHEADRYALQMLREDDATQYKIGCPDFVFNRAFCWVWEAARLRCSPAPVEARKLLEMAIAEIDAEMAASVAAGDTRASDVSSPWRERFKVLNPKRRLPSSQSKENDRA